MFNNSKRIFDLSYSAELLAIDMQSKSEGIPLFDIPVYLIH